MKPALEKTGFLISLNLVI